MLRAFSTLEGIGKTLDPDYRFSTIAQPFASELLSAKVRLSLGREGVGERERPLERKTERQTDRDWRREGDRGKRCKEYGGDPVRGWVGESGREVVEWE